MQETEISFWFLPSMDTSVIPGTGWGVSWWENQKLNSGDVDPKTPLLLSVVLILCWRDQCEGGWGYRLGSAVWSSREEARLLVLGCVLFSLSTCSNHALTKRYWWVVVALWGSHSLTVAGKKGDEREGEASWFRQGMWLTQAGGGRVVSRWAVETGD